MPTHPSSADAPVNIRRKIFEFIVQQEARRTDLPSCDDLRRLFADLTEDVDLHLEQLAREGLLVLDKNGGNGISVVPTYTPAPQIEVLGRVAHHLAQTAGGNFDGSIALDLRGIGVPMEPGMFAVQVLDDRMSDAGIEYGDIALLVHTQPMRGDIVAIEETEVMVLRRYVVVCGIPHFLAENPAAPDLRPGWDTKMHGVLWGLVRAQPCRRVPRIRRAKCRVDYSKGTCSDDTCPVEPAQSSPEDRRKPTPRRAQTNPEWPKPPSGTQLNETLGGVRLTEKPRVYDSWGSRHSTGKAASPSEPK